MAWHSWLTLAFLTGHHTPIPGGGFRQDAFIGSLVFFIVMTPIPTGIITSGFVQESSNQTIKVMHYHKDTVLSVYMGVAMVIMWSIMCFKYTDDWIVIGDSHGNVGVGNYMKENIPLAGLVIFFVGGTADDLVFFLASCQCASAYQECDIMYAHLPAMIFRIVRIMFFASLVAFCIKFHSHKFVSRPWVRYSLFAILGVCVTVWVNVLESEMTHHYGQRSDHYLSHGSCSNLRLNHSRYLLDCLTYGTTPLFHAYSKMITFIYPIHIEFIIIGSEILSKLWVMVADPHTDEVELGRADIDRELPSGEENEPLLGGDNGEIQNTSSMPTVVAAAFASVLNMLLMILSFMTVSDNENEDDYSMRTLFYSVQFFQRVTTLLTVWVGFQISANFKSAITTRNLAYSSLELLMAFSISSICFFNILDLIAAIACIMGTEINGTSSETPFAMLFVQSTDLIVFSIVAFYQTVFILHAGRVKAKESRRKVWFFSVVLYLCIFNFTLWMLWSFSYSLNPSIDSIGEFYYNSNESIGRTSSWDTLNFTIIPFEVFYSFTATILLLKTFLGRNS